MWNGSLTRKLNQTLLYGCRTAWYSEFVAELSDAELNSRIGKAATAMAPSGQKGLEQLHADHQHQNEGL